MSVAMCSCDSEAVSRSGKVGKGGENLLIKKRKEGKCERRKHSNKTERADRQRAALRSREGHAACQGTARQFRVLSAHISGEPAVVSRPCAQSYSMQEGRCMSVRDSSLEMGPSTSCARKDSLQTGDS